MVGIPITPCLLSELVDRFGGVLHNGRAGIVRRITALGHAGEGDLAPLFSARYIDHARFASERGAFLLVSADLGQRIEIRDAINWLHPNAAWALAELLDLGHVLETPPVIGEGCHIGQGAVVLSRVRMGARVRIGPGAVIGAPGFGFAERRGVVREVPQLGGVLIEDDVHVGPLSTIASGTLGPTILRRGVKLDAQVHVGHNCEIGEGTIIAAQTGIAGSVRVGRGVRVGGQVGIADHVCIGDGAHIAAKSGVIGDVAAGVTVAGYPAVERRRWLRGLAEIYRRTASRSSSRSKAGDEASNEDVA